MTRNHTTLIAIIAAVLLIGSAFAQDNHELHEHSFAKDVDAFHAVLAPLWHAKAGKERSQKVCTQADKLESLATGIHGTDTKHLIESLAAVRVQCQANPTKIDEAFAQVHEAFHHLAGHEEH
jgi:hypothetical protein